MSNPPWGKHIGGDEDGAAILTAVVRQVPRATTCWLANALALKAAAALPGVEIAHHCRVGSVEFIVLRPSGAPGS